MDESLYKNFSKALPKKVNDLIWFILKSVIQVFFFGHAYDRQLVTDVLFYIFLVDETGKIP
jgi:hypothetical protein